MFGGVYRSGDIIFGSHFGVPPREIAQAVSILLSRHHHWVRRVGDEPDEAAVITHGVSLHAELVRVHPFADGDGRLARLVQTWPSLSFGHLPPYYLPEQRRAYHSALSRYCLYAELEPLMVADLGLAAAILSLRFTAPCHESEIAPLRPRSKAISTK